MYTYVHQAIEGRDKNEMINILDEQKEVNNPDNDFANTMTPVETIQNVLSVNKIEAVVIEVFMT